MLRILFYPLMAMVAALILAGLIALAAIAIDNTRRLRALRAARWTVYTTDPHEGIVGVGVELVAKWGHHRKVIVRDTGTEDVNIDADDGLIQLAEAKARAATRAESYNLLRSTR